MEHRWLVRIALVLLVAGSGLALPRTAVAGGVSVALDQLPSDLQAGVPFTVGFAVRSLHDKRTTMSDLNPILTLTNVATNEKVTATATAEGAAGHYVVSITLPSAGNWQWEVQPFGTGSGDYRLMLAGPLQVRATSDPNKAAAPRAPAGPVVEVKALDSSFEPRELKVAAGTTVVWQNVGQLPHAVSADRGEFASGNIDAQGSFAYTFTEPGTYYYFCDYHGQRRTTGANDSWVLAAASNAPAMGGGGMQGVVIVAVASAAAAPRLEPTPAEATANVAVATPPAAPEGSSLLLVAILAGVVVVLSVGVVFWRARRRTA